MEKLYIIASVAISPGREEEFVRSVGEAHEAVAHDLAGTQLYEWYLSDDGREACSVQVYDDAAALAHHQKLSAGRGPKLRECGTIKMTFAGDAPQQVVETAAQRFDGATFVGPRAFGRLDQPTPSSVTREASQSVFAITRFKPRAGEAEKLRRLATQAFDQVSALEPETLAYEWFFDEAGVATTLDHYADYPAMQKHMANCGPIMSQIVGICEADTLVLGELPPEMDQRLRPELGIRRFRRRLHGLA